MAEQMPGQPDKRFDQIMTDQHGRPWFAVIEMGKRGPSGPTGGTPVPRFKAPVYPDQKYFRYTPKNFTSFVIDYDAIVQERQEAERTWTRVMREIAISKYADKALEVVKDPTPELLALTGPKPQPWQIWDAARKGNKWILGLAPLDKMPPWAVPFFPKFEEPEMEYPDLDDYEETQTFPRHVGGNKWELSDGSEVRGNRKVAEQAEAALGKIRDEAVAA